MKFKLGNFLELVDIRNEEKYGPEKVLGLSTKKEFITTKADLEGVYLSSYKCVPKFSFAYVADTSRRGDKISLAYNTDLEVLLVSSISTVFRVKENAELLPDYLFMYFNRPEFDRYARFNSWGSARETFTWEDMCEIKIELPPIDIQEKYVSVYKSMLSNLEAYEQGLEDLKLACDATIEYLMHDTSSKKISDYIVIYDERNKSLKYNADQVKGITIQRKFISTKANLEGVNLRSYKCVPQFSFAYIADTSRRGEKISLAYNTDLEVVLVSSISTVFRIKENAELLPDYLFIYFNRPEFDRYARFHSWGSARETFTWEDLIEVEIPIPDMKIQQSIVNIYNAYIARMGIIEKSRSLINDICPVLIKGSLEEVSSGEKF